jgi:hypothetical protein
MALAKQTRKEVTIRIDENGAFKQAFVVTTTRVLEDGTEIATRDSAANDLTLAQVKTQVAAL